MKKMLFFATLVACSLMFFSCEKKTVDPNQAAIDKVKAAAMGTWEGTTHPFMAEGEFVTVTFTETKATVVFDDETVNVNITSWNCEDGVLVWVDLDDDMRSALYIAVDGDNMTTGGNSTFIWDCFPPAMTRKK